MNVTDQYVYNELICGKEEDSFYKGYIFILLFFCEEHIID